MFTSSHLQQLQQQGAPVLLLADLLRRFPDLPAATYRIDTFGEAQLAISVHDSVRTNFEAWREALGLPPGEVWAPGVGWVMASGPVSDVRVCLSGYGSSDEIAAMVELSEAVALVGALPMPMGAASAEDPHDSPLHHSYALGRDLPEVAW